MAVVFFPACLYYWNLKEFQGLPWYLSIVHLTSPIVFSKKGVKRLDSELCNRVCGPLRRLRDRRASGHRELGRPQVMAGW